jgi:Domain of unknown function (DUF3560)/Large polyvalent protein associated domain 29
MSQVENAKKIRAELKAAFPGVKFWVTSKSAIRIHWIDGPTYDAVNSITAKYESISRCEVTGDILSGGNSFVFCSRLYSEASLKNAIDAIKAKNYAVWSGIEWDAIAFNENWDGRGVQIVHKAEYTVFDGYRRDLSDDVREVLKEIDLTSGFPVKPESKATESAIEVETTEIIEPVIVQDEKVQAVLDARAERFNGRKERRIERYNELSQKHEDLSDAAYNQSKRMGDAIPFGQPILVGHHSEGRDRRYRAKIWDKMGQSVKHDETAKYYTDKAKSAEFNHAIRSDDPEAIAKLKAQITELEELQESMKAANKIVKSKKLTIEQKTEQLKASGHSSSILRADFCGRVGYAGYQLTNNNANIRRLKERLTDLEKSLQAAAELGDTKQEYPQHGLTVVHARSINRLQLVFDGKPPEGVRTILKSNGFRWAPSEMAWQRFLSNSQYALRCTLEALDKALVTA